ncbi:MAG: Ni/Fe hydrogenase subunit alpha [Gammaproteobacteria bacterium]|nr:Ni/Fe hydrogenase subunit alpha [Gammaproteobacteria bacterium]MBL6998574.1 Ni/Fe hydrogenase subunit alpha [Gammaproteobacteria bacterium]
MTRISIDPISRVEGHGKITLQQNERLEITEARLHIVEFRGFEKFIQGRPYQEVPVLVQRLCGICPVSHHLAAAKATDMLLGVKQLSPTADKMRRLMHFGQVLQSHALHFFHLSSPDLLFGYDDEVRHRNIIGVIQDHPELAKQGVLLRKYGQEVIRLTSGKRIHGTGAIPGGINKFLSADERDYLQRDSAQIIAWAQSAVELFKTIFYQHQTYHQQFASISSHMMSLVQPNGALELYDGGLRVRKADNTLAYDHYDPAHYLQLIGEHIEPWSYMKFPFLKALGVADGWYRVGPLARINNCNFIDTPLAEEQRQQFKALNNGLPVQFTLAYHWARLIELLHCAESIATLLQDPDLLQGDLTVQGEMQSVGIGVIEAPRGTLMHHYEIDADGLITRANLIVSTTHNNRAMNESIRQVASRYLSGNTITEPLLNQLEVAVRAYDPCLSCATHALGKMPLEVTLLDQHGEVLDRRLKSTVDG